MFTFTFEVKTFLGAMSDFQTGKTWYKKNVQNDITFHVLTNIMNKNV